MQKRLKFLSVLVPTRVVDAARQRVRGSQEVVDGARRRVGHPRSREARSRSILLAFVVLLTAISQGCKPFNVKPRIDLRGNAKEVQAQAGGLVISASVVRDEDWLTDTFDANLILAGIVPIRLQVKNAGQVPIDLSKVKFELRTAGGRNFGSVNSDRAFKQALSYYEISAWSKALYKESRADFASYGLDTKTPAANGESRTGLIYFLVPGEGARGRGFTLVVSKIPNTEAKGEGRAEMKLD